MFIVHISMRLGFFFATEATATVERVNNFFNNKEHSFIKEIYLAMFNRCGRRKNIYQLQSQCKSFK